VRQTVVASPAYLATHGVPIDPPDLSRHPCIVGGGSRIGTAWPFGVDGRTIVEVTPRLTVNTVDATIAAAEAGLGFANLLSYQVTDAIADGRLVPVLAGHAPSPLPVSLLYDAARAAMPSVRLFIDAMQARANRVDWQ
jgi:DNA-binding transcriptional LysR family regulator